jgi:anti-sigma28 factor (negative regulator of flagellin synthesis)
LAGEPEIRKEKVEEVRNKINQGYYNSPEFVDKLAEKLLTFFGISEK